MTALAPRDYSHVSTGCAILWGNRIDENGASVGSTHAASVHKSKGTRPMAYSNITYSTPQLNSPVIGGVA